MFVIRSFIISPIIFSRRFFLMIRFSLAAAQGAIGVCNPFAAVKGILGCPNLVTKGIGAK
jgi:hypothetical protein